MNLSFKILISSLAILFALNSLLLASPDPEAATNKPFPRLAEISFEYDRSVNAFDNQPSIQANFLKSALVPGWGELSVGNKSGYAFLAMEVLLWSGRFYFLEEVKLREEESYIYALNYAGILPGGHDANYMHLLTRYNSSGFETGGYNEMVLRRAQILYPDDRDAQNQYLLDNAILDEDLFWSWESREHRRQYSIMRKNADHNRDYAKAMIGAIVANHIISAINSVRVTSAKRRQNLQIGIDYDRKRLTPLLSAEYRF